MVPEGEGVRRAQAYLVQPATWHRRGKYYYKGYFLRGNVSHYIFLEENWLASVPNYVYAWSSLTRLVILEIMHAAINYRLKVTLEMID